MHRKLHLSVYKMTPPPLIHPIFGRTPTQNTFNFVCNYKATYCCTSDKLGQNSGEYITNLYPALT